MPEFSSMLDVLSDTLRLRDTARPLLPFGYYANVIDLGGGLGVAISTDGVGTKILIARMMNRFDTIGIDCVAMNVNDVICVGAEPVALVDYVAVETTEGDLLPELAKGLKTGAELSNISIPGGEIAQIPEMLRDDDGAGKGFDLVGTCIGTVPTAKILTGKEVTPGDAIIGFASSGVHSNGLTLARRALIEKGGWKINDQIPELGRSLGEELLEPTRIYVSLALSLMRTVNVRALAHITSDGFINLRRIDAKVGFEISALPEPPAVFGLIQNVGGISSDEMFTVYNMGVGFCAIVPEDAATQAIEVGRAAGIDSRQIGVCTADEAKRVVIRSVGLQSKDSHFESL